MQEHIRRAHPEHYIAKLPATKESFDLMINSPPTARPPTASSPLQQHQQYPLNGQTQQSPSGLSPAFHLGLAQHGYYGQDADASAIYGGMQSQARSSDEYRRGSLIPAASAAQALAQLHYHNRNEWDSAGQVNDPPFLLDLSMTEADLQDHYNAAQDYELKNPYHVDNALDDSSFMPTSFPHSSSNHDQSALLSGNLTRSPTDRLHIPPLQRSLPKPNRPRKSSLTQQGRAAKHERKKSKDQTKRSSGEKRGLLSEHNVATAFGKRWEDLLDAATSATEEDRDLTPVSTAHALTVYKTAFTKPPNTILPIQLIAGLEIVYAMSLQLYRFAHRLTISLQGLGLLLYRTAPARHLEYTSAD